jgi:alpha-beta hydrolase superfamily lysophospholipase
VHGLGEHTGRYAPVGRIFADSGFALLGFDQRGHGLSDGPRGHAPSYEALLDDVSGFLEQVKDRHAGAPIFLYGHSLGGNLVLNFALRRNPELQGVIATAPWLRAANPPPTAKVALARALNHIAPAITQKWGLETAALSHDAGIVEAYDVDPLVHGRISVRLFVTVAEAGEWALEHAESFPLPLLLMHGTADRVTSAWASQEFAARAGTKATWRGWNGLYHELHNEAARTRVLGVMIRWMDGRLQAKPPLKRPAGQKASRMRKFGAILRHGA